MMQEIIATNQKLKDCPFCGGQGYLFRVPLWNGSHGYYGNYDYHVGCMNPGCGVKPWSRGVDDIYHSSDEAINTTIKYWNERRG